MSVERPSEREAAHNLPEITVSELSTAIKRTVEENFGYVRLRGEISGYRGPHSSGHVYFAIKDASARIDAVIWKGIFGRLRFRPEEGLEVIATGRITTFPGKSSYQIIVEALEPAGIGALMAMLEERRKRLAAEGLFDERRKQELPYIPDVVGVITSPTGAVIRDILHRLADRFPRHVLIWPVRVQGETSAAEVAAAIRGFDSLPVHGLIPKPDVLIVARGGGSLEDLWSFNEEIVVRAAAECLIPLIAAVGHETDWTLIDLVADKRAPTPTAAAEMAVPVRADLVNETAQLAARLGVAVRRNLQRALADLRGVGRGLPPASGVLAGPRQRLDLAVGRFGQALVVGHRRNETRFAALSRRLAVQAPGARLQRLSERLGNLSQRLARAVAENRLRRAGSFSPLAVRLHQRLVADRLARAAERLIASHARSMRGFARGMERRISALSALGPRLENLGHRKVLQRGFALVRDTDGRILSRRTALQAGLRVRIEFADGEESATVGSETQADPGADAGKPRRGKPPSTSQGDLF